MIILKIGGSILTKKDSAEPEVDYENLNRIASEIEESLNSDSINRDLSDGLIIVHGAGSFGHPPASKYKIGEPFNDEEYPFKRLGFAEIQNQVKKLNSIICDSLIEHNIPVVSIPPSSFVTTVDKRIYEFRLGIIKKYIIILTKIKNYAVKYYEWICSIINDKILEVYICDSLE